MQKQRLEHKCPVCEREWETVYKDVDLKDSDGRIIHFKESCYVCSWVKEEKCSA